MVLAACGRIDFGETSGTDDGPASDSPRGTITWAQSFVAREKANVNADSFTAQARNANDAIVMQIGCNGPGIMPTIAVSAPGWSFVQLAQVIGDPIGGIWSAPFGAIAPDALPVTVTVSLSQTCTTGLAELADEFAMTDLDVGTATFGGAQTDGYGDCIGQITTGYDDEAIWAACTSDGSLTGDTSGFTRGADDHMGDYADYDLTILPAGTVVMVDIPNDIPSQPYVLSTVAIKPR